MKNTKLTLLLTFAALNCSLLAGCGNSSNADSAIEFIPADTTAVSETQAVTTITSTTSAISVSSAAVADSTTAASATEAQTAASSAATQAPTVAATNALQTAPPVVTAAPVTEKPASSNSINLLAELTPGKDCTQYIESHQNFNSKEEAASCLGEGKDCSYFYNGYSIYSYRDEKGEILTEVDITGKGFTDMKGAACGMTRAEIEKIHGKSDDDRYEVGDCTVEITYQDDIATMIAVFKPLE